MKRLIILLTLLIAFSGSIHAQSTDLSSTEQVNISPAPLFLENLRVDYSFVDNAVQWIHNTQNTYIPIIAQEKLKAEQKRIEADFTINPEDDGESPFAPEKEKDEVNYWLWSIYGWIVSLVYWLLFSWTGIGILFLIVLTIVFKIISAIVHKIILQRGRIIN